MWWHHLAFVILLLLPGMSKPNSHYLLCHWDDMELCGAAALAVICYACGLSMLVGVLLCLLAFVSSLGYYWLPLTGMNELYPGRSWKQKNKHKNLSAKMWWWDVVGQIVETSNKRLGHWCAQTAKASPCCPSPQKSYCSINEKFKCLHTHCSAACCICGWVAADS